MTDDDLLQRIRRHNAVHLALGVLLVPSAILLWFASFWVFRVLFVLPCVLFGNYEMWPTSFYVAWGCVPLLAVEGLRYRKQLFSLSEYTESLHYAAFKMTAMHAHDSNPFGTAWIISRFLFCAPRATVHAAKEFRSIIRVPEETVRAATEIVNRLAQERRWIPWSELSEFGPSVLLLGRLRLVWTKIDNEELQLRIPPRQT